ncbi:MAG TPA: T9SS type B sorting domain-containing protein, partial [Bacteroidetes bacterium]|nr:T9SS type B sorting domain-containing protein [Bacteroidota bacterium]
NPVQVFDDTGGFGFQSATVTIDIGGCTATDFINITWVPFDVPEVVSDMTICQNSVVQLAEQIESLSTTYQWTPEEGLLPSAQVSGPFAMPDQTTTYTLVSTAGTGDTACKDTASVTLTVLPADIDIDQGDTTFICLGETATLTNTHTPNALDIMWSPSEFLTVISPEEVEVTPPASQYYYATIETADCVVTDSIWVQVDSLPDLSIMADPMKPSYCEGEEVLLSSPTYEPAHFSAIEHFWDPNGPGAQTPDSFLNMVIIALEDFTYIRTTTVNACTSVDSIFIKVTPVTSISVVPSDTTVCPGDQVQLTIEGPAELTEFMWMPPDGLSCTDCREPIATAQQSVTYQVEAEFEGCPVGASATINVPSQFFSYTGPTVVCPGTTVLLNSIFLPGAIYNWTSSNGSVNTTEPQPSTTLNETTTFNLTASLGECTFETSFTIEVLEDFTVSVEQPGTSCPGDAVTLSAVADPSSPNINYSWTNATTGQMVTGNPVTVNPVETATWTLTATDACFTNTVDVVVEVAPQFGVTVSPAQDNVIAGTPSTFTASATTAGIDFVWQEIPGGAQVGTGPSITVTNCESQQYQVTGTDFNGCTQTAFAEQIVSDAFSVGTPILLAQNGDTIVFSDPLMGVDSAIYEGEQVEMVVEVTPPISGATYIWVVNGDTITTTQDPSSGLLFLPEVSFDINSFFEVIVVGPSGCDDRGVLEHFILNNPVEAPNVFTPNNDQKNDKFALVSLRPVEILDFRVWNRWGKLVYDNKDGQGFWDGTINGKPAASDVYVFSITYQIPGSNNPMKPLRGDLTLLR